MGERDEEKEREIKRKKRVWGKICVERKRGKSGRESEKEKTYSFRVVTQNEKQTKDVTSMGQQKKQVQRIFRII